MWLSYKNIFHIPKVAVPASKARAKSSKATVSELFSFFILSNKTVFPSPALPSPQLIYQMFRNTFQSGFLSILYSIGSKPLQIWDKKGRCFFISFLHLSSQNFFPPTAFFRPFGHLPSTKRTHHRRHTCTTKGGTALWHCFNAHHRPLGAILAVHVHRVHLFYYRTATPTDANNNCHEKKKSHESTQRPTVHTRVGPIGNARLYRATPRPSSNGR